MNGRIAGGGGESLVCAYDRYLPRDFYKNNGISKEGRCLLGLKMGQANEKERD